MAAVLAAAFKAGWLSGQVAALDPAGRTRVADLRAAYMHKLRDLEGAELTALEGAAAPSSPHAVHVQPPRKWPSPLVPHHAAMRDPHIENALAALRESGFVPEDGTACLKQHCVWWCMCREMHN